jgi:hypothetical protein
MKLLGITDPVRQWIERAAGIRRGRRPAPAAPEREPPPAPEPPVAPADRGRAGSANFQRLRRLGIFPGFADY